MLTFYGSKTCGPVDVEVSTTELPKSVTWIDAYDPTPDEQARLERLMGTRVPTLHDLEEIETSSRLAASDEAIVMSLPGMVKDDSGYPRGTPIGFVVTPNRVATLRYARLPSFEHLSKEICEKGALSDGGLGATVSLLEVLIDHIADLLERIGQDMDNMSREIFAGDLMTDKARRPHQYNRVLLRLIKSIGRDSDLLSKVSQTLLGLGRMGPFLIAKANGMMTSDLHARLDSISADVKSLHEFQDHLSNKTQFLLDTVLGLTNIEQNNVFRILTVVSVIGIPPTFVASMYGMNFKSMPELEWHYGYAYGLTLIAISAIAPAIWFKIKGWW